MSFISAINSSFTLKKEKISPLVASKAAKGFFAVFMKILLYAATVAAIYFAAEKNEPSTFVGDAGGYWKLMYGFFGENGFAFENANLEGRGYLTSYLPLIFVNIGLYVFGFRYNVHAFYFGSALFFAAVFVFVCPYVFERIFKKKAGFLSRVLFLLPIFFFWKGDFAHPLTDFPALSFVFIAIAAFFKISDGRFDLISLFLIGASAAAAYNLRQSYLIFLYAVIVAAIVRVSFVKEELSVCGFKKLSAAAVALKGKWRAIYIFTRKLLKISVLVIGVVTVMLPQVAVNNRYNKAGWQVPTELYVLKATGKEYPLMLFNTNALQTMQKADFWVIDFDEPLIYTAVYQNTRHEGQRAFTDYGSYFKDVLKYPSWYLKSWVNGAFLGMTVTHDAAYITDYSSGFFQRLFIGHLLLASFTVSAAVAVIKFLLKKGKFKAIFKNGQDAAVILSVILSAGISCLTKMECRYLMPLHFAVYGTLAFNSLADLRPTLSSLKEHYKKISRFAIPALVIFLLFGIWYFSLIGKNTLLVSELLDFIKSAWANK